MLFSLRGSWMSVLTKEVVTNQTVFEAASISKPVFAYFIMKQVEKGLLDLDKPLYEYFPIEEIENDERYKLITARMILCHTSGLPNWRSQEPDNKLKIRFEPNSQYGYSGEGYQYLKDVIAHILKVDDIGLGEIFKKQIAEPLGARHMDFVWKNEMQKFKAFGHRNGKPTDNEFQEEGNSGAFGASYSLQVNSTDYSKFLIEIMKSSSEQNNIVSQMLTIQNNLPNENGELHRSLAFPIKQVNNTIRYYHSGNNGDFRAYCHFYKEKGYGIVMLSNCDNFLSSKCAQNIVEFLGDKWFYV